MQGTQNSSNDTCPTMNEHLLRCGHVLDRLASYKIDSSDLNDFAESIAATFKEELLNGNLLSDPEPSSIEDWQSCQRLQPDDSQNFFLSAGYNDCMDEAIRFLIEEEDMGPEHPVVRNLKSHLEQAKDHLLSSVPDPENNNLNITPSDISYDCYMAVNFFENSPVCNTSR